MSAAAPTMNQPYYPAEGGEAKAHEVPFKGKIIDQYKSDLKGFWEGGVSIVKEGWGIVSGLAKAAGAIANADMDKDGSKVAEIFSPEGAVGKIIKGAGNIAAHATIGLPLRLYSSARVHGIPGVKHVIKVADKVTFGYGGKAVKAIPGIGWVASKTNQIIQGEVETINRNAAIVGFEQSRDGLFSVQTDQNLSLAKEYRSKYQSATPAERKKILKEFQNKAYDNFFGETTTVGGRLSSPRKNAMLNQLEKYVKTGNATQLDAAENVSARLSAISAARKYALSPTTLPKESKMKDSKGNYVSPAQLLYRKKLDALVEAYNAEIAKPRTTRKDDQVAKLGREIAIAKAMWNRNQF